MRILILRGNNQTPKSYPFWAELLPMLADHDVREVTGICTQEQLKAAAEWCDIWITIDSFWPHYIKFHDFKKRGIVLWGPSDPLIFGYPENVNLLKSREHLRPDQFRWWKDQVWDPGKFVPPEIVLKSLTQIETAYTDKL